jgi:tyrosyl-tRNA synthetase
MRQLQDLGHTVIFLIGDFTSMIGDPSGRNITRPPLTRESKLNKTPRPILLKRVWCWIRRVLRFVITPNGAINLGARGMIELSSRYTVARILEREDFSKRFKAGTPISVHELTVSADAGIRFGSA